MVAPDRDVSSGWAVYRRKALAGARAMAVVLDASPDLAEDAANEAVIVALRCQVAGRTLPPPSLSGARRLIDLVRSATHHGREVLVRGRNDDDHNSRTPVGAATAALDPAVEWDIRLLPFDLNRLERRLSPTQQRVLQGMVVGLTGPELAAAAGVSRTALANHLSAIRRRAIALLFEETGAESLHDWQCAA